MPLDPAFPRLRALDIRSTLHQGQPCLLVRDPLELSGQYLILPQALGPALLLLDGAHALAQIPAELHERWGVRLESGVLAELVAALDHALFLDNAATHTAHAAALQAYRSAPYRQPTGAGEGYPADPEALRDLLDGYLAAVAERTTVLPAAGRAIISPHIDYQRGGKVYARVWKETAAMARAAELVVVLGVDHYAGYNRVTLTRQSYATPYGVLPTAVELVDALATALGPEAAFAGELYHSREHSIELVLTWLHHMRGGQPVAVLPILTGSFQPFLHDGVAPDADPAFAMLLSTLTRLTAGRQTLWVASGDLAHLGPAFGGEPVGIVERAALRDHDAQLLQHLAAGDADAFWAFIRSTGDAMNVCGVSPFYLTLKLLGAVEGQPAGYAICPADGRHTSVVSVCGMVFG